MLFAPPLPSPPHPPPLPRPTEEMDARRQQREKETEDLVRRKFQMAEEEKQRKMQAYSAQKPTCERDSQYHAATQRLIQDKFQLAEEDKQKKLEAYKQIAQHEHTADGGRTNVRTTTTTAKAPGDPPAPLHPLPSCRGLSCRCWCSRVYRASLI